LSLRYVLNAFFPAGEYTVKNSVQLLEKSTLTPKGLTLSALARYSGYLKAYYKALLPMPKYKWPPAPAKKSFNLQLVRQCNASQKETTDELKRKQPLDLADVITQPEDARYILVEGDSGVGKTTLLLELCRKWDEIEAMRSYSLVLLLRMRDRQLQEARTIADLFYHHDDNLQHSVTQEVVATRGEGVLLIFDGLDQLPPSTQKNSLLMQVLQGVLLPKATILFTIHPSATESLPFIIGRPGVDRHVELVGFTDKEIYQHAENALGHCSTLLAYFQDYISSNPAIRSVMHVPLNTAIVVQTFKEAAASGNTPLKTLTDLYRELTKHILKYHMLLQGIIDHTYVFPESLGYLPPKVYQQLCTLGKLAFAALVKQELVFKKLPRGCFHMGFMNAFPELYTRRRICASYSFLHLNLQAYLAALYIAQLSSAEQIEILRNCSTLPQLEGMWKFLAGITGFKSAIWDLAKSEICQDAKLNPFVLRCLYEAHEKVACETVLNTHNISFPQVQYGKDVLPLDCFAIGCCLAHSTCTLSLRLRLNTEMIHMLVLGLKSSSQEVSSTIETLFLRPPLSEQTIAQLSKIPPYILQGMDLSHSKLDPTTLDTLSNILPSIVNLKHLDVRGNPLGRGGAVKLLQSLRGLHKLQSLNIINTGIGCDDIEALSSVISLPGTLRELQIGDESMPPECTGLLVSRAFANSSLDSLHLWLIDLEPHLNHLSELLKFNSNITKLEFHGCKIGGKGGQVLAKALTTNTALNTLVVTMFDVPTPHQFGTDGALALSEMLKVNQTLQHLEFLFEKSLGRNGALGLANALHYNNTLKSLKLPQQYFSSEEIQSMDTRVKWSGP